MAKEKTTAFFCSECGGEFSKWMGQCPACKAWNTLVEEPVVKKKGAGSAASGRIFQTDHAPAKLSEIDLKDEDHVLTGIAELDRVLGGGVVPGAMVLVGGDPGIGKSTLLLQMCRELAGKGHRILYVSGEESLKQIKMRAMRLGDFSDALSLYCETDLTDIENAIVKMKPEIVVIDSIQTMYASEISSAPGSVSQVREACAVLLRLAKSLPVSVFIVGHVTKEGTVAGPRVLEHMVDTVLYFEGDSNNAYRILRSVKNRFGSTNEIGVFEMCREGLTQVLNPSEHMLSGRPKGASGSVVVCTMEGTRPLLIEIQALVCRTSFGMPRRQATGVDYNRVNLLMAVLEKRIGIKSGDCDAYVNVAGGLKLQEPAVDLGVCLCVVSSYENMPIDESVVVFGEVGLSGEVRSVSFAAQRIKEAEKMGFSTCILPKSALEKQQIDTKMNLIGVSDLNEAIRAVKKSEQRGA
ncbi:MAG: DNA repair protein RadA [Lachnospiraceae bacterium]|nr:DNA repair protein RadA [Lachnospiraceae bacterium]